MKTITISTENSETYSSISNFFIDYYMTDANGEFVKVYLYLVRLLSTNTPITVTGIADHFNLTEKDICRAIKYWIGQNVLRLNYDGKGNLSGIVLLPLYPPQDAMRLSSDAVSILRAKSSPSSEGYVYAEEDDEQEHTLELVAPPKQTVTPEAMTRVSDDDDWHDLVYQLETIFKNGKPLSKKESETLMYIYDSLGFSADLIEYLIEYCTTMDKTSFRYMETIAIDWYKDGIKTRQQAKDQSVITNGIKKIVFKALGVRRTNPTTIELAYINTWHKDFGFSPELISYACDRALEARPGSANFAYINGILENWHKNGVKTFEDIEQLDKAFFASSQSKKTQGTVSSFNNFKQTKMDNQLKEMEDLFLKEVNK